MKVVVFDQVWINGYANVLNFVIFKTFFEVKNKEFHFINPIYQHLNNSSNVFDIHVKPWVIKIIFCLYSRIKTQHRYLQMYIKQDNMSLLNKFPITGFPNM